jgi:hypothetical protein
MNTWILKPFTAADKVIKDRNIKLKENSLVWEKITCSKQIFRILIWQLFFKGGLEYQVLSERPINHLPLCIAMRPALQWSALK